MKTLVVTEKKSVADDFAKVLGGFDKSPLHYERDDMVIAWASGHLLELQGPSEYDKRYKRWVLGDLPIIPEAFRHVPREDNKRNSELLERLVDLMAREDVGRILNACDAGREGELIFQLILEHAIEQFPKVATKTQQRLWLQSMTKNAIQKGFDDLKDADSFSDLKDAAFARDEADWMIGMNGTRAFTRKFMGRARQFFAVGRVKTPTLAFLVDREREIDAFEPVPYFQVDATFEGSAKPYDGRWSGRDEQGRKIDRLSSRDAAVAIVEKVKGKSGTATDSTTSRKEIPPLLYDLTSIQREASSRFGFTLDRTLSACQSLYEARKAITYPRTSSRYLPQDYEAEIQGLVDNLRKGDYEFLVSRAMIEAGDAGLKPPKMDRVFNDKKVSDHFALIPTGENPKSLKDDEKKIYELILRRFFAVFLPHAQWSTITRETVIESESFVTRQRRLDVPGWRAVEPLPDHEDLPELPADGTVKAASVELLEKETQAPARYTDGSLVKAMETSGRDLYGDKDEKLDEDALDELKEKGIGTPATRAAIVKDLIMKRLARRQGRNILPTPLGCNLVRLVRNLDLDILAKPDLTGDWEYRLAQMAQGDYPREEWDAAIREQVHAIIDAIKVQDGGSEEVFRREHLKLFGDSWEQKLHHPGSDGPLVEKTFSYMSPDNEDINIPKDQKGKYLFPELLAKLLEKGKIGPLSGFEGTRAQGWLSLGPAPDYDIDLTLDATGDDDEEEDDSGFKQENVPEGTVIGTCPKCKKGTVTRQGKGYKCSLNIPRKKDKECDFRLAERIKYRYLPLEEVKKLIAGEKTEQLFGFVSMRGRKFKASLFYDEEGQLQWEFPPRATKKKTSKKKASKKKASKKKASKKKASKKKVTKKVSSE